MATPDETHEQRHRRQAKEFATERFAYLLSLASPTTPQPSEPGPLCPKRLGACAWTQCSHPRCQPSEPGTTPEELATIVAEETARTAKSGPPLARLTEDELSILQQAQDEEGGYREFLERELGEATRDQWDQLPPQGTPPTPEQRKAEHERWIPLHRRLAQGPDDSAMPRCSCSGPDILGQHDKRCRSLGQPLD